MNKQIKKNQNTESKNIILNNNNLISEETSKRINSLRFLLAVLVVFKHNCYRLVFSSTYDVVFNQSNIGDWIQIFISYGLAHCAVPLFFLFAAFIQVKKADPYKILLKKKSKSLVIPYIIWISIYFFLYVLTSKEIVNSRWWDIKNIIHYFFGFTEINGGAPLAAGQFWFVRDLIIFTVFSPFIIYFIKKMRFLVILCFFIFAESITIKYAAKSLEGLFFYTLGLYWGLYDFDLFKFVDRIKFWEILPIYFFTEIFINTKWPAGNQIILLFSVCIIVLKLSKYLVSNENVYKKLSFLSNYSFFLYAIHMPIMLSLFQSLWIHIFPMKNTFFCLFEYFGVSFLIVFVGTLAGIVLKKFCRPIYNILNGGRK